MKRLLILVFMLAFVLRIIYILALPLDFIMKWESDAYVYKGLALNILSTHSYGQIAGVPDAQNPPLYPCFLAFVYIIFGAAEKGIISVRLIQALISSFVCIIVFYIAQEIFDKKVAIFSAFLVALHPALIAYTGMHLTETLYIFILFLFILYMLRSYFDLSFKNIFLCGLLFGLSILTREVLLLFPFFLLLGLFFLGYRFKELIKYVAIMLIGLAVIIGPWTIRNFVHFNKFIPVTEGGGHVLYAANYIPETGKWVMDGTEITKIYYSIKNDNKTSYTKKALRHIAHLVKDRPLAYLDMLMKKFKELWLHPSGSKQIHNAYIRSTYVIIHYILLLLCFLGIVVAVRAKNKKILPLLLILFYVTFLFVFVLFPLARYFLPFLPLVFILSSRGLFWLIDNLYTCRRLSNET